MAATYLRLLLRVNRGWRAKIVVATTMRTAAHPESLSA
jgi:hypothetical protein